MENLLLVLVEKLVHYNLSADLSGKMLTFPQETNTAHVTRMTSREISHTETKLKFFTSLRRNHILFSLATLIDDAFVIFKRTAAGEMNNDYTLNTWHSIYATWASETDLGQLWLDGKPSTRKFLQSEAIKGKNIILGQEQVKFGWLFAWQQSFIGLLTDVHMWDNMLSPCEIQRYTNQTNFTPGNVLHWGALDFQTTDRVLLENKQSDCNRSNM
uniref:Pentraxin family member n=1 Tax=Salmo trutta TaxID=8032 RepID=A0A674DI76_SALTR